MYVRISAAGEVPVEKVQPHMVKMTMDMLKRCPSIVYYVICYSMMLYLY